MNPESVARLIGRRNEGPIILEDKPLTALIDSGASVTTITEGCCQDLGLQIKPLDDLLHVEGTSGHTVPYKGYVEANLQIPRVDKYRENILLLVLPNYLYGRKVPVQIGTKVIDRVLQWIPDGKIIEAHGAWKRAQASAALMAGIAQVGEQPTEKRFCPPDAGGPVAASKAIIVPPFGTVKVLYEAISCSQGACNELQVNTKPGDMALGQWVEAQIEDPTIGQIRSLFKSHSLANYKFQSNDSEELGLYLEQRGRFKMKENILYREIQTIRLNCSPSQLVLPTAYRKIALQRCHEDVGHLGIEGMLDLLRDRFYWPNMQIDAEQHVKSCERCLRFEINPEEAELQPLTATYPVELVHLDYLTIESRTRGVDVNILVITDHFTRYAQALITSSQTARVTAQALWERFVIHCGLPERLSSDQGHNFESELVQELSRLAQVEKLRTIPYHPTINGRCERFNATLIGMLGTLTEHSKAHWSSLVPTLVHAYNCTKNNSTGFSPYFLMYGRKPELPLDLYFNLQTDRCASPSTKFVQQQKNRLQWAYSTAQRMSAEESKRHKRRCNRRAKCSQIELGDVVLVRCRTFTAKHKIADRWKPAIYEVVKQLVPCMPIFRVKSLDGSERTRIVHRNLLLPLQQDPDMELNTQEGMDPIVENTPPVEFNSEEDDSQQVPIAIQKETVEVPNEKVDVEVFTCPRTESRGLVATAIVSTGGQIRHVMRSGPDHLSHRLDLH